MSCFHSRHYLTTQLPAAPSQSILFCLSLSYQTLPNSTQLLASSAPFCRLVPAIPGKLQPPRIEASTNAFCLQSNFPLITSLTAPPTLNLAKFVVGRPQHWMPVHRKVHQTLCSSSSELPPATPAVAPLHHTRPSDNDRSDQSGGWHLVSERDKAKANTESPRLAIFLPFEVLLVICKAVSSGCLLIWYS
jgi:hypothetical protein